jgi:large subunit ribosomal protein L35
MPKLKSNKAVLKRIRITAKGKLKRPKAGRRHLATAKSSKQKRNLRRPTIITGPCRPVLQRLLQIKRRGRKLAKPEYKPAQQAAPVAPPAPPAEK